MSSLEPIMNFSSFHFVNSTLAPTCVLFICVIIMIVFSTTSPIVHPPTVVWGTQTSMTFLSAIVTFVIWFLVKRNAQRFLIEQRRNDVTLNIKLTFFWIFGLLNIFNSAMNMGANVDCLLTNGRQPFPFSHVVSIFVHITEILFCIGQLGFLSLYGRFCFKPSPLINYGVSLIIIAHLLRWFRILFDSILNCSCVNWITLNATLQEDCFYSSDIFSIHDSLFPYINPIITEYSLLSAALVVRMFVNVFSDNSVQSHTNQEEPQETSLDRISNEESSSSEVLTRRTSTYLSLSSKVVISLPMLVMYIYSSSSESNSTHLTWQIISTVYEFQVLSLLLFGKWEFKRQFSETLNKETTSCGYRVILIFVTAGTVAYVTFGGIAGLMNAKDPYSFLLFVKKIIQTIFIITQTLLILGIKNTSFRSSPVQVKYFRVNRIFLCIFTVNTLRWLVDSVAMGHPTDNTLHVRQRQFYGHVYWRTIENTIFPINVFYRFLTAIEMYELYRITQHASP